MWTGAALVVIVAAAAVDAQVPVPQLPDPRERAPRVFRSETAMVALNVTVTDTGDGDKLVTGLEADDFEVYEDGVQQELRFFESSNVPMDVILLLDISSSMRDRMAVVHDAARTFMKVLRPGDRGAVVAFNEHVRVLQELTADPAAIERAINAAVAQGSTGLHNAIYVTLKQFGRPTRGDGEVRRQALAVLSDGEDTSSLVSFEDVLALARQMGVSIYTIGLQSSIRPAGAPSNVDRFSGATYSLNMLARETGARAFFPATVHDLKRVYGAIARELEAQYSIGYSPTNPRMDGRFRRIVVRVTSSPHHRPRTRTGYTAGPASAAPEAVHHPLR
jgi:Ca-activated chloride channel family protein